MATARKLVSRALRRIGYLDPGEPLDADDGKVGLDALNAMMHGWATKGLTFTHTTLPNINAEVPLHERHEQGLVAMLAVELTDEFAPEALTPILVRAAANGWSGICGQYFCVPPSRNDLPENYHRPAAVVDDEEDDD